MKIDHDKLIQEWNKKHPKAKLTAAKFAREIVKEGFFTSEISALNMMRISDAGKAKKVDIEYLLYLMKRFNKRASDILKYDEPTVSDVAPSIRDDAPGLNK